MVRSPAGATILTAEVSGEKVKPVQGADGDRVPLLRRGFRPAGEYSVFFVFLHSGAPFAKKGDSDISLPKMDVPINVLEWELFLPDRFKVRAFTGDAMSASLLPAEYQLYSDDQARGALGGFQAGIGTGTGSGVGGGMGPVNGRNGAVLMSLAPGVVLAPGQLGGYVFDPSRAVIPNAHLPVQNLATGASWSAISTADGSWRIIGLPSSTYQVTATAPGFQNTVMNIPYDASNPHAYRVGLNVGATSNRVTVEASAIENTESSTISSRDKKHKKELPAAPPPPPTASANVFNLQQRVAAVMPVAGADPR